jgi:hypothetical protein
MVDEHLGDKDSTAPGIVWSVEQLIFWQRARLGPRRCVAGFHPMSTGYPTGSCPTSSGKADGSSLIGTDLVVSQY